MILSGLALLGNAFVIILLLVSLSKLEAEKPRKPVGETVTRAQPLDVKPSKVPAKKALVRDELDKPRDPPAKNGSDSKVKQPREPMSEQERDKRVTALREELAKLDNSIRNVEQFADSFQNTESRSTDKGERIHLDNLRFGILYRTKKELEELRAKRDEQETQLKALIVPCDPRERRQRIAALRDEIAKLNKAIPEAEECVQNLERRLKKANGPMRYHLLNGLIQNGGRPDELRARRDELQTQLRALLVRK